MEIGKTQDLYIQRFTSVGAYLNVHQEGEVKKKSSKDILLPKKFVEDQWKQGDRIQVFVLRDSDDRLIATRREPKVQVGKFARLQVVDTTRIGAFLDWGLDKDLFLPHKEQVHKVKKNEWVYIYCYLDKSQRIASSMKVKNYFQKAENIKINEIVEGEIYSVNPKIGAFVIVENRYNGLIPREKYEGALDIGKKVQARVENIKADGKLNLTLLQKSYERIDQDAEKILDLLRENDGFLPYNDYSKPEDIRRVFNISKSQFKKSIGHLKKMAYVRIEEDGIYLKDRERK